MPYVLNFVYLVLLAVLSPWLVFQAIRKGKYREGYAEKFLGRVPVREGSRPCVWLHAVSVGEVNLLAPLLDQLARRHPDWECVVSTTTKTGYALAKTRYAGRTVFHCPLDFSWAVGAALRRIRPDLLVLAELELWPNLIGAARRRGVKIAIVNGRLSEQSFRGYMRVRPLVARVLAKLDLVATQNEEYAGRFRRLGADERRVHATGSLKFDGAQTDRQNPATASLRQLAGFAPDDVVLLAGSTQDPEEALALATFRELNRDHANLRLVLVPRHPERFEAVAAMLSAEGVTFQRRSSLLHEQLDPEARVLLVDGVGELGAWWGTATIALVGGSLSQRGGQNMIEPAAYGAAVSFGPNTWNFRDVADALVAAEAAVVVRDQADLTAFVRRCLNDPQFAADLGQRAQALVLRQLGATERTVGLLERLLPAASPSARTAA